MDKPKIYCDGGAFPNPGKKVICIVYPTEQKEVVKETGQGTNNEAEYEAFIEALVLAKEWGLKSFTLCSDSMLVLKQLSGEWLISKEKFWEYKRVFDKLKQDFDEIDFEWVSENKNLAHNSIERLYPEEMKMFSFKKGG